MLGRQPVGQAIGIGYDQDCFPTALSFYSGRAGEGGAQTLHCFQTVHTCRGDVRGVAYIKAGTEVEFCFREEVRHSDPAHRCLRGRPAEQQHAEPPGSCSQDFSLPPPDGFEPVLAERNIL